MKSDTRLAAVTSAAISPAAGLDWNAELHAWQDLARCRAEGVASSDPNYWVYLRRCIICHRNAAGAP